MRRGECTAWLLVQSVLITCAASQFVVYNGDTAQIVFGAQGLYLALQNTQLPLIIISGNVTLTQATFAEPIIVSNRSLTLVGDANQNITNVLNFGGLSPAIVVADDAKLTITNLTLAGTGAQNITDPDEYQRYRASGLGSWPSLIVEPNTEVTFNQTNSQFYSQISWSACNNFAKKVTLQLMIEGYAGDIQQPSPTSVYLGGDHNLTANVTDIVTNEIVGNALFRSLNATNTCVNDPYQVDGTISGETFSKPSEGSSFKWWMGLLIGLAVLLALLIVIVIVAVYIMRLRKAKREQAVLIGQPVSKQLQAPMNPGTSQSGSANTTSDEAKVSASASPLPLAAGPGRLLENGSAELLEAFRPPTFTSASHEGGGSAAPGSASARSDLSNGPSGNLASPWSDVTALLRARSDFSDIEVGPLIGRGSFGRVYKGRWKGAFVAIKIVDHQEAASKVMALREGSLSSLVQHPNVVTTYSVFLQKLSQDSGSPTKDWEGERKGVEDVKDDANGDAVETSGLSHTQEPQEFFATCMVLEYCDRGTLEKAVQAGKFKEKSSGEPDMRAIHRTLLDIAGGMDYLHSVGVMHGDLKGANVLLKSTATDVRGFTCKLADFGMARLLDGDRTHVSTATYGTISYMPAELLKEGKLTRAVDSYSFAILMWELFAGRILHDGLTMAQVFYKVCYEEARPPLPEHMPEAYASLMQACWHEDPLQRPSATVIFSQLLMMSKSRESGNEPLGLATSPSRLQDKPASKDIPASPFASS